MFRINIENLHLALLESDTEAGAIYGTDIDKIPGTMAIKVSPQISSGKLYGDGKRRSDLNKVNSYELALEHNKIPYSVLSKYMGHEIDIDGVMTVSADDVPLDFALGYEVELEGDGKELIWFLKCSFSPGERNDQQSEDNITYSVDNMTVKALPLKYNNDIYTLTDTSDEGMGVSNTVVSEWFNAVRVKPPKGTQGG